MATLTHSHTYQHFDELQLSAQDFYTDLKALIESYQYPSVTCRMMNLSESGFFSTKRLYLCVSMGMYEYYVCAAPFGKSFFISWWLEELDNGFVIAMRKIPILRWLVDSGDKTYFQIDTELMFTKSIDALVRDAIAKIAAEHGFRSSTLAEPAN
jgi:hypothetical protein